ncbi:MAG: LptF/LptG family permease [Nitrospirota bacterium]
MRIVRRYYVKEFLKVLGITAIGLSLIFGLLDLIDKIDDLMPRKPSVAQFFLYIIYSLPKYLYYLLPMSLLICSLFIFSQASRNKELVAIRCAGGRLTKLFHPFIILGLVSSLLGFFMGEIVTPAFSERNRELRSALKSKGGKLKMKEGTIWLKGKDGSLIRLGLYIPDEEYASEISVFVLGESVVKERIEAEAAEWVQHSQSEGVWKFKNANIYDMDSGKVRKLHEMDYAYLEAPDFFSEQIKKPDEMGLFELFDYSERLKAAGFNNPKLSVDISSKISYPFTNFFMLMLGISLSVCSTVRGGLFATGLGLFLSFIYWLGYTFMLSMGYAGIIPAAAATWTVPLAFGIVAFYFFWKMPV